MLTVGSLCSGYGGLDLGLALGLGVPTRTAWHVEYDGVTKKGELAGPKLILAHRFPDVPNYGDVKLTDWAAVEPVDWLTAGYPCQPFSHAGLRKGTDDSRHLWPGVARAISVLRPRNVLLENVRGHVSLGLDAVLANLAGLGYDTRWGVVRAADAGAPHNRARLFIVAADASRQRHGRGQDARSLGRLDGTHEVLARERQRPRPESVDRDAEAVADTGSGSLAGLASAGDGLRLTAERGAGTTPNADRLGRDGQPEQHAPAPTGLDGEHRGHTDGRGDGPNWGAYESAIRRWEAITGRTAPRPTEPGARTGERLSPAFVEWLMGLPRGWVTDVPGLPRNAQLKALGNGVVPQQAALAVRLLSSDLQEVAA